MEVQSAFAGAASAAAAALGMGDAFHIDDLLDFSNEDIAGPIGEGFQLSSCLDSTVTTAAGAAETVSCTNTHLSGSSCSPNIVSLTGTKHLLDSPIDHPHTAAVDVLCVPCDDLAELEWLSKFVEDSFSMGETPTRGGGEEGGGGGMSVSCADMHNHHHHHHNQFESYNSSCKEEDRFQSASPVSVLESSASSGSTRVGSCTNLNSNDSHNNHHLYRDLSVPGRARSKRARTGGRVWGNSGILAAAAAGGAAAASSTTTDTESLSSDSNVISGDVGQHNSADSSKSHQQHQQSILLMMTPPPKAVTTVKKPWKPGKGGGQKDSLEGGSGHGQGQQQPWRCLHCATQRTPQWRAGPMGPKTLCNACGVRYKSGRLLPEYRPAGSPGYVGHKHSNSHKKILEMRRQRETASSTTPHHLLSQFSPPLLDDDPAGICTSEN